MTPKLAICTPVYGALESASVSLGYHKAIMQLVRASDVALLPHTLFVNCDLVRARSRAVRMFLDSECTHLLFWDEDVVPRDVSAIPIVLHSGREFVAFPYPRKITRWDIVSAGVRDEAEQTSEGRQTGNDLRALSLDWTARRIGNDDVDGFVKISECGMGLTMLSRSCCERMYAAYICDGLDFDDGRDVVTIALFALMFAEGKMLSEDYSFCRRWRGIGGDIWAVPDPAWHVGSARYGVTVES